MKILVITLNAWNLSNSTGNTISNLFAGLNANDEVANIYCRNEVIDNTICKRYFKVTESDILKNIFTHQKCGSVICNCFNSHNRLEINNNRSEINNNKRASFFKKHRHIVFLLLREIIWTFPVWKNDKFKGFVRDFAPDVIYMHGHYNLYMHWILSYCQEISGAKVVMYWGDDMYGRKNKTPLGYFYESLLRKRFRKSIEVSSLLFGGSLQLCDEYSKLFDKKFTPFFKECKQIRSDEKKKFESPLTVVYAGNLLFGREAIMVQFVKAIAHVNYGSVTPLLYLKIISNTVPSKESLSYLDDKKNSCFLGSKSYSEVCEEMDKSDMALFIESFAPQCILSTRLSFSTKIIDCLQSKAAILAIGPKEIASIDYLSQNHLGYIITDVNEIEQKLSYLTNHPEILYMLNKKKVEFAIKNHTNTSKKALTEIRKML